MTTQTREFFRGIIAAVISSMIVSVAGGGIGVYVAYSILSHRVAQIEHELAQQKSDVRANRELAETKLDSVKNQLADVARDVAYLRGASERKAGN